MALRERIVDALGQEWPLSLNGLAEKTQKPYSLVRKEVVRMLGEGILLRKGGKVELNPAWIAASRSKFEKLERARAGLPDAEKIFDAKEFFTQLTFDSISAWIDFAFRLASVYHARAPIDVPFYSFYRHSTWPLFYLQDLHRLEQKRAQRQVYCICEGNTPLDRWCCEVERKFGWNVKCGIKLPILHELQIFSDCILEVWLPKSVMDELDAVYEATTLPDIDVCKVVKEIFGKKKAVAVNVIKDSSVVARTRRMFVDYFEKRRVSARLQQ